MTIDLVLDTPAVQQELATISPALLYAPYVTSLVEASLTHAQGALLRIYIELLDELLRTRQAAARADRLHLINLRHVLMMRREAEELAADPNARQVITTAASHFARKAQSGFSPLPLPE